PDSIAVSVYVLIGIAIAAVLFVVPRILVRRTLTTALVTVLAAALVLVAVGVRVNLEYESYPTVGSVFGDDEVTRIDASELTRAAQTIGGRPLTSVWSAPGGLPDSGRVLTATIPPTA